MAAIYKKNDKFGLMSDDGHPLTDADFDRLAPLKWKRADTISVMFPLIPTS